jgi:hypothetical protein
VDAGRAAAILGVCVLVVGVVLVVLEAVAAGTGIGISGGIGERVFGTVAGRAGHQLGLRWRIAADAGGRPGCQSQQAWRAPLSGFGPDGLGGDAFVVDR